MSKGKNKKSSAILKAKRKEKKSNSNLATQVFSSAYDVYIMPITILIATFVISLSLFISANKVSDTLETAGVGNGNTSVAATDSNDIAEAQDADVPSNPPEPTPQLLQVSVDDDAVAGDFSKAEVGIVEFSDYECPFCKRFYDETYNQIVENYVDTGVVALTFRDLPLNFHPLAQVQAEGAECIRKYSDDATYFEAHNAFFEGNQDNEPGKFDKEGIVDLAGDLGVDENKVKACIENEDMKEEVDNDAQEAQLAGINGTPGFVIGKIVDGEVVDGELLAGAFPYSEFSRVIESYRN